MDYLNFVDSFEANRRDEPIAPDLRDDDGKASAPAEGDTVIDDRE